MKNFRLIPILTMLLFSGFCAWGARPAPRLHLADYDNEPRRPDGHVDGDALLARLKQLQVNTYYWLIWHNTNDWEDLKAFLPRAAGAGIDIWAYLVPPTESAPQYGTQYSEPFRLDYPRWAEEIAKLSLAHTNLTGWVIDDFYANHAFFTPGVVRELRQRGRDINPRLTFMPLMYFGEIRRPFVQDYHGVIDGVVVAYPRSLEEIESARAMLNDEIVIQPGELSYPWSTASEPGEFAAASQTATVLPDGPARVRFQERDDFTAATSGYHFKQLLVGDQVVWEEDVAGGSNAWREVVVDLSGAAKSGKELTLAFRLYDKKGVGNFGVSWQVKNLRADGLRLAAGLDQPQQWKLTKTGAFEGGFDQGLKPAKHSFQIPFIVMTAGEASEFKLRHGDPPSPERMAEWLQFCLQAYQDGKCDGVVTYCLEKQPGSKVFDLAAELFGQYRKR